MKLKSNQYLIKNRNSDYHGYSFWNTMRHYYDDLGLTLADYPPLISKFRRFIFDDIMAHLNQP